MTARAGQRQTVNTRTLEYKLASAEAYRKRQQVSSNSSLSMQFSIYHSIQLPDPPNARPYKTNSV